MANLLSCIIFSSLFGAVVSVKSIREALDCVETAADKCFTQCQSENADIKESAWADLKTCKDNKISAVTGCYKGLDVTKPCFPYKSSLDGMNNSWKPTVCVYKCMTSEAQKCTKECKAKAPKKGNAKQRKCVPNTNKAFKACVDKAKKSAQHK